MRNSAGAAFDLAEYAAGTDDSLPLRSPIPLALFVPRRYTDPAASSSSSTTSSSLRLFPWNLTHKTSPAVVALLPPSCRPKPLINGPAHFAGSDAMKNYALLNTDELLPDGGVFRPCHLFWSCSRRTAGTVFPMPVSARFLRVPGRSVRRSIGKTIVN